MKTQRAIHSQPSASLSILLMGLAVGFTATVMAQPYTNFHQGFDTFASALAGPAGGSATVAPNVQLDWIDTDGAGSNGCVSMVVPWVDSGGGWQEVQLPYDDPVAWPGLVAAPYATAEFDIKVVGNPDPGSDGTYGRAQLVLQGWNGVGANGTNNAANWITLGPVPITTAGVWQHVVHRLIPFEQFNMNKTVFNIIAPNCTNTIGYLIDNLEFKVPTNPPPTLALGQAPPAGLHLVTAGGPQDRQAIRTVAANLKWYGRPGPVTYSLTVNRFPPGNVYSNYMAYMLLIPYAPGTTAPDWDATNVVRLDVQNHGSGTGYLRFKTNAPGSNGGTYTPVAQGGGTYPGVPSTTLLGTWSLTFENNTNVRVTAPDGTSSNYVFEAATDFNGLGFRVYYGAQANETVNLGQEAILSGVNISGTVTAVSDTFSTGTLDGTKWQKVAAQPDNVFVLASVKYNVSWPLPDNLFKFITSPDPVNMTNSGLGLVVGATTRSVNVPFSYPTADLGFFGLVRRDYAKLQVLMPGESAAPGTPTGKTGTPANQKAGVPFQVQINAVDDRWNQAFCSHPIYLESQPTGDGSSFKWADQLVHGSYSYTFTNTTAGTFIIHALDNADGTKTGDGSSYTVDP